MAGKQEPEFESEEGIAGSADPSKRFREMEVSEEERAEIERTRQARLDPENRPENAEVDNTHREFDSEAGMFTDAPGYEQVADGDKPYDDDAGEMKAPDKSAGTETSEEPTA